MKYFKISRIILLSIIILAYLVGAIFLEFPLISPSFDSYSHLGGLRLLTNEMNVGNEKLNSNMFPLLYGEDIHFGPYFFLVIITSSILNISQYHSLIIFGAITILLLFIGIFKLFYLLSDKNSKIAILTSTLFFLIQPLEYKYFSGREIFDRYLVTAHYPALFALALLVWLIYYNLSNIKNIDHSSVIISSLLLYTIILSHLFTAIVYAIFFIFFSIEIVLNNKSKKGLVYLCGGYLIAILLSLLWPYYHWVSFLFHQNIITGQDILTNVITFPIILELFNISLFGLLSFFYFKGNKSILFWILSLMIISISFLTGFTVPVYYRFISFLKIFLIFGLCTLIDKRFSKKAAVIIISAIIIIFLIVITSTFYLLYSNTVLSEDYSRATSYFKHDENVNVLADSYTENYLQKFEGVNVYFLGNGHTSDLNSNKINLNRIDSFSNLSIMSRNELDSFFNTNKIDYIFLPYDSKQLNNIRDNYNKTEMEVVFSGRDYVLIKNNYSKIS